MADELVDIFDENNNFTNVKKMKSKAHSDGSWHRAVHVIIYNSKGEILLQLRAKDKLQYPDLWDISAAGHVTAGEEPIVSCMRELEEEIGFSVGAGDLQFFRVEKCCDELEKNNEFGYIYFLKFEGDINSFQFRDGEVQKVEFVSIDRLEEDLKSDYGRFCPHGVYWFDIIAEVRKRLNSDWNGIWDI